MKALTLTQPGGLDRIVVDDIADPGKPGAGEIRVAIKANSLNYHDLLIANGTAPTEDGRLLLSDGAGVVESVGEGVTEFQPGDKVVSTFFPVWEGGEPQEGSFRNVPGDGTQGLAAEFVVRPVSAFTHAPKGWSHTQAATITTAGLTAWRALVVDGNLKAGETVLVQGTGGVSLAALQIAKAMGAQVVATSSSDAKLERAKKLGADITINYNTEPDWGKKAFKLTGGVDHVVEVGGPDTFMQSIKALRVGGHVAVIGVLTGSKTKMSVMALIAKQARVQGLMVGSREDQKHFIRALAQITFDACVDSVYPPEKLAEAYAHQQAGKHFGKVCIEW